MPSIRIHLRIPLPGRYARNTRNTVAGALKDCAADVRRATVIVAWELMENAIKYGGASPGATDGLPLTTAERSIGIEVSNEVTGPEQAREEREHLDRITRGPSQEDLDMERLPALLSSRNGRDSSPPHRESRGSTARVAAVSRGGDRAVCSIFNSS